jgi:hypothetical protein
LNAKAPLVLLHRELKTTSRWWNIFLLFSGTFVNAIDRASLSIAARREIYR